ncbi:MAG: hypothetical protein IRZ16_20095 [Myxococcaceae bacterium]|nr:hypothetical protein [Myxococcaceae bacterium]
MAAAVVFLGAAADAAPAESSGYERRMVDRALAELGRRVDPSPFGKRIRTIYIVAGDIIAPDDPYPRLLNVVHVTTRDEVIHRELLFAEGEVWDPARVAETERNLRSLFILALARIVPLDTGEPGTVDVLVATRDLWSIRFNSSFNVAGSLLQFLRIRPTEQNLLGFGKQLSGDFELRLDTLGFGQEYVDRRVFGTHLLFGERARLFFNRATGALEGSEGLMQLGRPLFSLQTEWGFETTVAWDQRRVRLFRGADIEALTAADGEPVPWIYDRRELEATALYTRSFGADFKWNVSAGAGAYAHAYRPPEEEVLTPAQRALLEAEILPISEDAAYAKVQLHAFSPTYRVLRNVESFARSEDYQVGPGVRAELRAGGLWDGHAPGVEPFIEAGASAHYREVLGDSLLAVSAGASTRVCPEGCPRDGATWVNQRFAAELLFVTQTIGPGRFALRGLYEAHRRELDRRVVLLGGGNGLRGAPPELLAGDRMGLVNFEYRTLPLEVLTLHLGAVAFYDVGTVFSGAGPPTQTAGVGLRLLFPQFDVEPIRIDFGYVLAGGANPRPADRLSSSFGQVERYRPAFLDAPLQ